MRTFRSSTRRPTHQPPRRSTQSIEGGPPAGNAFRRDTKVCQDRPSAAPKEPTRDKPGQEDKLQNNYFGPYRITEKTAPETFGVTAESNARLPAESCQIDSRAATNRRLVREEGMERLARPGRRQRQQQTTQRIRADLRPEIRPTIIPSKYYLCVVQPADPCSQQSYNIREDQT